MAGAGLDGGQLGRRSRSVVAVAVIVVARFGQLGRVGAHAKPLESSVGFTRPMAIAAMDSVIVLLGLGLLGLSLGRPLWISRSQIASA